MGTIICNTGFSVWQPPKIKSFINNVTSNPLENIEDSLKGFVWDFEKVHFEPLLTLISYKCIV